MSQKDSSPWPSIHNMLNGWLCHFSCSIRAFSFSITPRQSALILTQPTFHFLFFFLFSDTLTPLLPLSCLSHSDQICSFRSWGGGEWNIQKPLHLWSNSETPCPPWSICHHAECQEVSLGLSSGHSSAWHLEREKERNSERRRKRKSGAEGEWTWQRPWNTSVPLSRARGLRGPAVSTSH